jgi:hypothetical protein
MLCRFVAQRFHWVAAAILHGLRISSDQGISLLGIKLSSLQVVITFLLQMLSQFFAAEIQLQSFNHSELLSLFPRWQR